MDPGQTFTIVAILFLVMSIMLSCRWYVARVSSENMMRNMPQQDEARSRPTQPNSSVYTIENDPQPLEPKLDDRPPSYDDVVLEPYFRPAAAPTASNAVH